MTVLCPSARLQSADSLPATTGNSVLKYRCRSAVFILDMSINTQLKQLTEGGGRPS